LARAHSFHSVLGKSFHFHKPLVAEHWLNRRFGSVTVANLMFMILYFDQVAFFFPGCHNSGACFGNG
jgi:hypothetical protein